MASPDYAAFYRTGRAYAILRKRREELMREAIAGKVQVTLGESLASAHEVMEAHRAWEAICPGSYGPLLTPL